MYLIFKNFRKTCRLKEYLEKAYWQLLNPQVMLKWGLCACTSPMWWISFLRVKVLFEDFVHWCSPGMISEEGWQFELQLPAGICLHPPWCLRWASGERSVSFSSIQDMPCWRQSTCRRLQWRPHPPKCKNRPQFPRHWPHSGTVWRGQISTLVLSVERLDMEFEDFSA